MALSPTLAEQFQTPLSQGDNLALIVLLNLVVELHLPVCNLFDHLDDVIGLTNKTNELLVFGLEQLQKGPDGNVLECRVAAVKKSAQVPMDTLARLRPVSNKDGIVAN